MSQPDFTRLEGYPHPRETLSLIGHERAEAAFLDAWNSGRLPHAWLIGGEEGIGKATFAYRIARFVMAQGITQHEAPSLDIAATHPAARKVIAGSHPDLFLLSRIEKDKGDGFTANIPVALVRRATELLGSTAAEGGWRVCVIDSVDDLDAPGANALLKSIEEPPPRCLFLLIAHQPGRVLPTIRSRCRRLLMQPLEREPLSRALESLAGDQASPAMLAQAAELAQGSVRRGLDWLDPESLALISGLRARLERLPEVSREEVMGLAGQLAARKGNDIFPLAFAVIEDWIGNLIRIHAGQGAHRLAPLMEVWEKATRAARDVETYNLDRRPLVMTLFQDLSQAVRPLR